MLILAFDTSTDVATSALVADGERARRARLGLARALLDGRRRAPAPAPRAAGATSTRSPSAPGRGASRARASGSPSPAGSASRSASRPRASRRSTRSPPARGAFPVIDARRGEVFVPGPRACAPDELDLRTGSVCVGGGAVRYRDGARGAGRLVPPDDDRAPRPVGAPPRALAATFGPAEAVEPIYVRAPDAERCAA